MRLTKSQLKRIIREAIWETNLDDPEERASSLDQHLRRRSGKQHPQGPPALARPLEGASYRANMDHLDEEDKMLFDEIYTFARQYIKMNMEDAIRSHQELRQAGFTPGGRLGWKAVETRLFNGQIDGVQDILMAFDMEIGGSDNKMEMIGAVAALLDHALVNESRSKKKLKEAWGGWTAKPKNPHKISSQNYNMIRSVIGEWKRESGNNHASISINREQGEVRVNGILAFTASPMYGSPSWDDMKHKLQIAFDKRPN